MVLKAGNEFRMISCVQGDPILHAHAVSKVFLAWKDIGCRALRACKV
jgi:hypothetical protein